MQRRRRRWKRPHRTPVAKDAPAPGGVNETGDGPAGTELDASGSGMDPQPVKIEERFGIPKGAGRFFRIETTSGRSFVVWANSEETAQAAAERIDRVTIATGRETFRVAAVPVSRIEGLVDDRGIAKVCEIKS